MRAIRLRHFASLNYLDAAQFLIRLRKLELPIAKSDLPREVRTLRTRELKQWRELREAALFCHFVGELMGIRVSVARGEAADYDAVARWTVDGKNTKYTPIQIKEVVPASLNANADLSQIIASLSKYVDSSDLTVAVHLNKRVTFDLASITIPTLSIASLWVFGSVSPDSSRWRLWGNLLDKPQISEHDYPTG